MKYCPGAREAGMVVVQELLLATSWPIPHRPVVKVPEIRPASFILNWKEMICCRFDKILMFLPIRERRWWPMCKS